MNLPSKKQPKDIASEEKQPILQHRAPSSSENLHLKAAVTSSVGWPAVFSTLRHVGKYMDIPQALRASIEMNQQGGFDCAGCAWPDPEDDRSGVGEYCENGIKALAEEATKYKADATFWAKNSVETLSSWSDLRLGKSGRITEPLYRSKESQYFEPIPWALAFEKIGAHLRGLANPDEAIFYTSGRTSNEAAFLYGLFARMFGTNNLPDCSNMCHESSGKGLSETVGIGKGSVRLRDIHEAELIIIMGQNPGTNHPRMLSALEICKTNGGKIIAVNPLKEAGLIHYTNPQKPLKMIFGGIDLADLYLQVRINGDVAFLKAIMIKLFAYEEQGRKVLDHAFIDQYTSGFEALKVAIAEYDYYTCCREAGLNVEEVEQAAELIASKQKIIICWAMGLTQHLNGVDNVKEIVNLLLLKGAIGKPGAGTCPVRGHSNVQGDRTMGIWEKMPEEFHQSLSTEFGFQSPRKAGYDTVETIKAMVTGGIHFFMSMGGNFLSAAPDTDITALGLKNCSLAVHVSTKPNRTHLIAGVESIILPCLGRSEWDVQASGYQFVSVENSMGIVHSSKGVLPPTSDQVMSECAIVAGIAKATFEKENYAKAGWDSMIKDYDLIRQKIENVIPGFERYNERVRHPNGFELPNPARSRIFLKDKQRARFSVVPLPSFEQAEGQFRLMTIRSHDQFNTTIYGLDDRYRGVSGDRYVIFMHPQDMIDNGLDEKELVRVTSHFKGTTRSMDNFRVIPYDIPRRCLAAYFPEANPLVHLDLKAEGSHTPASKMITVTLHLMDVDSALGTR